MAVRKRMNTVYVPVFDPSYHDIAQANKHGLRDAFGKRGTVIELDYVKLDNRERNIREAIEGVKADLLWMQSAETFSPDYLRSLKADFPGLKIANWMGDPWLSVLTSERMIESAKAVDVQLVVNAACLETYAHAGVNASLWPHSFEPVDENTLPDVPEYDVVFLGNCRTAARQELERILRALPYRVGIYGSGWQSAEGNCQYDFATGYALYRKAKLTVSDNDIAETVSYLSDRPFQAWNAGCCVLQQVLPGLLEIGIRGGYEYGGWSVLEDLPELIAMNLNPHNEEFRQFTARTGQQTVREHHNFDVRVEQLMTLLEGVHV